MVPNRATALTPVDVAERVARPEQLLYALDDVALALRISRAEVERLVARHTLASVRIGRLRRVSHAQLEKFVSDLERQSA